MSCPAYRVPARAGHGSAGEDGWVFVNRLHWHTHARAGRIGTAACLVGAVAFLLATTSPALNLHNATTVAGTGKSDSSGDGGPANLARLSNPQEIAADHKETSSFLIVPMAGSVR
jgi:hypothetical protein